MSIVESLPTYGVHYYAVKVRGLLGSRLPALGMETETAEDLGGGDTGDSWGDCRRDRGSGAAVSHLVE